MRVSASTLAMSHSSPSFSPEVIKREGFLPSFSFALQAQIVQDLSFIMFKLRSSSISSAGSADIKSCLFANINNGNPANLSSLLIIIVSLLPKDFVTLHHTHPFAFYLMNLSHRSKRWLRRNSELPSNLTFRSNFSNVCEWLFNLPSPMLRT